jgi:hypothetical protein
MLCRLPAGCSRRMTPDRAGLSVRAQTALKKVLAAMVNANWR